MQNRNLDSVLEIPAPEFIVFRAQTAGPMARFMAVFLDHAIIFLLLGITAFFAAIFAAFELAGTKSAGFSTFLLLIAFFFLQWFYFFAFEWLNKGRTPGKMALGLRVISIDGTAVDVVQILIRNMLRIADMFPFKFLVWLLYLPTYTIGLISSVMSAPRFRRLGDLAAGTIVIREIPTEKEKAITVRVPEDLVRKISFRILPSATLVQALHDFASRYEKMHPARRMEIADRVRPGLEWLAGHQECTSEQLLLACHRKLTED
ncbi:MAG TPA: RDD family protein [Leptospiraceae bacterium]|nr:RDD family protein [Leptospirales bacterium]HMU85673.1 RDD family protein [Leptospiraceae bacterium]HMW58958.1 RDD family protein [Leptospiraceae bacterium]HMX56358.1 RDD family protein [Leptospiraceae bacterium]HMY44844.1 RDD family protein [Leptospiraceae bacterium]